MGRTMGKQNGFTLIEILIALLIFTIAGIAAGYAIGQSISGSSYIQKRLAALNLIQQKLDELRNTPYEEVISGLDEDELGQPILIDENALPGGIFKREWIVQEDQPVIGSKTIMVRVSWETSARADSVWAYTIVSRPFDVSS